MQEIRPRALPRIWNLPFFMATLAVLYSPLREMLQVAESKAAALDIEFKILPSEDKGAEERGRVTANILNQEVLPCLFSRSVLEWIHVRQEEEKEKISIMLETQTTHTGFVASYTPHSFFSAEKPLLPPNITVAIDEEIAYEIRAGYSGLSIMRNEFFHYMCDLASRQKKRPVTEGDYKGDYFDAIRPFINATGEVDVLLQKKFKKAVGNVFKKIEQFRKISEQPHENRSAQEQQELLMLDRILQAHHTPMQHKFVLHPDDYKYLFYSKRMMMSHRITKIVPTHARIMVKLEKKEEDNFLIGSFLYYGLDSRMRIDNIFKTRGGQVILYVSHQGKDRIGGFLSDFECMVRHHYDFYKTPSKKHIYDEERASSLSMFHPEILRFIAEDFCNYMGEYLGLDKGAYCGDMPKGCVELHQHSYLP